MLMDTLGAVASLLLYLVLRSKAGMLQEDAEQADAPSLARKTLTK